MFLSRLKRYYPSTHILIASRWSPAIEYEDLLPFPELDVFVLEQYDEELRAERDGRKIARFEVPKKAHSGEISPLSQAHFSASRRLQVRMRRPREVREGGEQAQADVLRQGRHAKIRPDQSEILQGQRRLGNHISVRNLSSSSSISQNFSRSQHGSLEICLSRASPEEIALERSRWDIRSMDDRWGRKKFASCSDP